MKAEEWRKNVCTRWNVVIHSNLSSNTFGHRVRYKVNAMRSLFQAHTGFLSLAFYSHWIATWKRDYVCSVITLQIYLKQFCSVEQKTFDLFGSLAFSLSLSVEYPTKALKSNIAKAIEKQTKTPKSKSGMYLLFTKCNMWFTQARARHKRARAGCFVSCCYVSKKRISLGDVLCNGKIIVLEKI